MFAGSKTDEIAGDHRVTLVTPSGCTARSKSLAIKLTVHTAKDDARPLPRLLISGSSGRD
jgi:hypothetical protein